MKRLTILAAVLVVAACSSKENAPAADTTAAPAMAPAPATNDSAMQHDSATHADSTKQDSTVKDTTKKP
jgi:uncharacterized lipoprotein YajG